MMIFIDVRWGLFTSLKMVKIKLKVIFFGKVAAIMDNSWRYLRTLAWEGDFFLI